MKGAFDMKEKYLRDLVEFVQKLDENQVIYVLNFVKKLFGSD